MLTRVNTRVRTRVSTRVSSRVSIPVSTRVNMERRVRRRALAKRIDSVRYRIAEVGWMSSTPFLRDGRCLTPLHLAVKYSNMKALHQLIAGGAQPNIPDAYGETPLHWAVRMDNARFAAALIAGGADPNAAVRVPLTQRRRSRDTASDDAETIPDEA